MDYSKYVKQTLQLIEERKIKEEQKVKERLQLEKELQEIFDEFHPQTDKAIMSFHGVDIGNKKKLSVAKKLKGNSCSYEIGIAGLNLPINNKVLVKIFSATTSMGVKLIPTIQYNVSTINSQSNEEDIMEEMGMANANANAINPNHPDWGDDLPAIQTGRIAIKTQKQPINTYDKFRLCMDAVVFQIANLIQPNCS